MTKRLGTQTVAFTTFPTINGYGAIVGKKEGEGPIGDCFDSVEDDEFLGEATWEKAETRLFEKGLALVLKKAKITSSDVNYVIAGDLLNQCTASAFGARESGIPYLGIYGACSTMAEGLTLAAMITDGGFSENCIAVAGSHFCSAEKQYRFPLEYGGQRPPSSQWTVTGVGATAVGYGGNIYITHATTGKIEDYGITDANNMGAAMAPAFASTVKAHFEDTGRKPSDYDLILSGDLGKIGKGIAAELLENEGYDIRENYNDCGVMIFDCGKQDTHSGGSGCGCSASVLCGYVLPKMQAGEIKNVLFTATGALMSPTTSQQGESILAIAHAVALSTDCNV
ncbi:MAG: stage V sporulation protein AD [Clostridia bacterium]|nr:stage V sporulation protein AD [Clostridia bacterium]